MPWCTHCKYYSDKTSSMVNHQKVHSKDRGPSAQKRIPRRCSLCNVSAPSRGELINHFSSAHDVIITTKNFTFENESSFLLWKAQIEKSTASRYVLPSSVQRFKDHKTAHYYCHRDGVFSSRSTGKRRLKMSGSNKINACCPARISATTSTIDGSVKVVFVETHVGHRSEVVRLQLSKEERSQIAAKIAAGIRFDEILAGLKDSVRDNEMSAIHMLTKKHLWNIKQEFNLNSNAVRPQSDYIHSWVSENQGNQVVRFYKQRGITMASHQELSCDDFILIIANDLQLAMLEEFGKDCVCIDGTRGPKQNGFKLTAIMVLDESRQAFPCAMMFSNRTDAAAMQIFFTVIKLELNSPVAPNVFMSGMAKVHLNAWSAVFSSPPNKLFCPWHVDETWKKNLSKVKSDAKKADAYKTLRTLMEETDEQIFNRLLEAALFDFDGDPEKRDFGKYFALKYSKNARQWAFCFRTHLGLSADTHLESLHETIKQSFFEGKKVERFDKSINVFMSIIRDKVVDSLTTSRWSDISKNTSVIRRCHNVALEMEKVQVQFFDTKRGWSISSGTSPSTFSSIFPWKTECSCELRCDDCNVCLHAYKCECSDSSIKWVICCHMHHMALTRGKTATQPVQQNDHVNDNDDDDAISDDELPTQDKTQVGIDKETSFENFKNLIKEEFSAALDFARTIEELEICRDAIIPLIPTSEAAGSTSGIRRIKETEKPMEYCQEEKKRKKKD